MVCSTIKFLHDLSSNRSPMGAKIILYSVFCFAKFVVAFAVILAVAVPRQKEIQGTYTNATCWQCYNRSLEPGNSKVLFEFGVCHDNFIDQKASNLMVNKGYWDTSTDPASTVKTYVWLSALLFVLGLIGAAMFLVLGYLSKGESDEEGLALLFQFVRINFYESVGVMMMANSIWNLYLSDGCWISPLDKSYITGQSVLLYMYIAFAILESFCKKGGAQACMILMSALVLFGYAILSVIIASMTFIKSRDPYSLILVVLAFISIFEVPSGLFGFTIVQTVLRRAGLQGAIEFR